MKNVRREIFSFGSAIILPLAMVAIFPYGSIGFKASGICPSSKPFAAFVTLTPQEEARATTMVKAAWQSDSGQLRHIRADLSVGELPEEVEGPVLEISAGDLRIPAMVRPVAAPPFPPSMQASAPEKLALGAAAPEVRTAAFPKEELLKIE